MSREGELNWEGSEAPGEAEGTGKGVQPREKEAPGSAQPPDMRGQPGGHSQVVKHRTKGNGLKLRLGTRKKFPRRVCPGTGCLGKCNPHPWRYLKAIEMWDMVQW